MVADGTELQRVVLQGGTISISVIFIRSVSAFEAFSKSLQSDSPYHVGQPAAQRRSAQELGGLREGESARGAVELGLWALANIDRSRGTLPARGAVELGLGDGQGGATHEGQP
eukprot:SAG31_NODE_603_length_13622_cov_19.019953_11_plen_113_part_00